MRLKTLVAAVALALMLSACAGPNVRGPVLLTRTTVSLTNAIESVTHLCATDVLSEATCNDLDSTIHDARTAMAAAWTAYHHGEPATVAEKLAAVNDAIAIILRETNNGTGSHTR